MLISFSVKNYKSFKDLQQISFVKSSSSVKNMTSDQDGLKTEYDFELLRCSAMYGANASGKSNLFKAIKFMRSFVLNSSRESISGERIYVEPFMLDDISQRSPSEFVIEFIMNSTLYEYGFILDSKKVSEEWLYYNPNKRRTRIFERYDGKIIENKSKIKDVNTYKDKTRNNALFISVLAQFNNDLAMDILEWFKSLIMINGVRDSLPIMTIENSVRDDGFLELVEEFMCSMDISINRISIENRSKDTLPKFIKSMLDIIPNLPDSEIPYIQPDIQFYHSVFNESGEHISEQRFDFHEQESDGTQRLFALSGPIINSLISGGILCVDELDARLHSTLTLAIIKMFKSPDINRKGAQLLFTTHDTTLLGEGSLSRDQIWFAEKNRRGVTKLRSLSEYKGIRSSHSYNDLYMKGAFGALPVVGNLKLGLGLIPKLKTEEY